MGNFFELFRIAGMSRSSICLKWAGTLLQLCHSQSHSSGTLKSCSSACAGIVQVDTKLPGSTGTLNDKGVENSSKSYKSKGYTVV